MHVPIVDLKRQYKTIKSEVDSAVSRVLDSTQFIMGEEVEQFEKSLAEFCQVKHALGVSSGTDALLLALMVMGIKPGDEVITTPFTFFATAEVLALLRAEPVFVDIDPDTYNINPDKIEENITTHTRAVVPVHLYGHPADMDSIKEVAIKYKLTVIEDVAQALGSEYKGVPAGSIGDIGCLSFFPSKNLGAFGDAGAIVTNDAELMERLTALRVHGSVGRYEHHYIGLNARLDALQAAVLRVKIKYLSSWIERRREIAGKYTEMLSGVTPVTTPRTAPWAKHSFNYYTIQANDRDGLRDSLEKKGISTAIHYPSPLYLQEAFKSLGYRNGDFPVSEFMSQKVLSLPIFPELTDKEIEYVVQSIKEFYE